MFICTTMVKHVCCILVVLIAFLENSYGQSDALTQCSSLDFSNIPKTCCVNPAVQLFNMVNLTATTKNCKASSRLMSWTKHYKLNLLQKKGIANFVDPTDEATKNTLCIYGDFMACVFKENSWLTATGDVRVNVLITHILNQVGVNDTYWTRVFREMLRPVAAPNVADAYHFNDMIVDRFESINCANKVVNLKPLMMVQMIQSELIWMCPEQAAYTTVNKCTETMNNYQYCDEKIYDQNAYGMFFFPHV